VMENVGLLVLQVDDDIVKLST